MIHWIEIGLLEFSTSTRKGRSCRLVSPSQLIAFRQKYLPLADLAHAMESKPSYLAHQLEGIEILGAKVLPNGTKRGALLPLKELGKFAVSGLLNQKSLFQ